MVVFMETLVCIRRDTEPVAQDQTPAKVPGVDLTTLTPADGLQGGARHAPYVVNEERSSRLTT